MAAPVSKAWWGVVLAAALLLAVVSGMFVLRGQPPPVASASDAASATPATATTTVAAAADAGDACAAQLPAITAVSDDTAPILLWAVGDVRLFVNGQAAFSSPEEPLRLPSGVEHTLRAEAKGEQPLQTRFKLEPNVPALFHAQVDGGLGITLVRLGQTCTSCRFAESQLELDVVPSSETTFELLSTAAALLREDRWMPAHERLRRVRQADRDRPTFLRLASAFYEANGQPEQAMAAARSISPGRSNDLARLLDALDRLAGAEKLRRHELVLARWNRLTEQFGQLAARFQDAAPGALASAARRLEALGKEFERAYEAKDLRAERASLQAAEQAVREAATGIRSARPGDCQFQQEVLATLRP